MGTIALQVKCSSQETSGTFRMPSGDFWRVCIVENDILTMQRFLEVSRFLYSGGWQVCNPFNNCLVRFAVVASVRKVRLKSYFY